MENTLTPLMDLNSLLEFYSLKKPSTNTELMETLKHLPSWVLAWMATMLTLDYRELVVSDLKQVSTITHFLLVRQRPNSYMELASRTLPWPVFRDQPCKPFYRTLTWQQKITTCLRSTKTRRSPMKSLAIWATRKVTRKQAKWAYWTTTFTT